MLLTSLDLLFSLEQSTSLSQQVLICFNGKARGVPR